MRRYVFLSAAAFATVGTLSFSCTVDTPPSSPDVATKTEGLASSAESEPAGAPAPFERITEQHAVAWSTVSFLEEAAKPEPSRARGSLIKPAPGVPARWRDAFARMAVPPSEPSLLPFKPTPSPDVAALALSANFNALKDDGSGIAPPDTNGAAGPNHLMVALNTTIQVESKAGANMGASSTMAKFFASVLGANDTTSDPHVIYDPVGQRWIFVAISLDQTSFVAGGILLGVSTSTDPTSTWHLFKVPVDPSGAFLGDYPIVGFNKSWISVSLNLFDANNNYSGARVFVFDKAAAYAGTGNGKHTVFSGAPIQVPVDAGTPDANVPDAGDAAAPDGGDAAAPPPPPIDFSLAGAWTLDPAAASLFLLEDFDGTRGNLRLFQVSGNVGAEKLTKLPDVDVKNLSIWADGPPAATNGNFVPQKGGATPICANDSRFTEIVQRGGLIWAAHPVFLPCINPDGQGGCGTGPDHVAAQWLVIDPATSQVVHAGRQEDPTANQIQGTHYFFPSLMPNKLGDALFAFSQGGVGQFVSAGYTMRFSWDPPNTMRDPAIYKEGLAAYDVTNPFNPRNRWGDYSITSADPTNDTTLWTIQEYAETPNPTFGTWWGELSFACAGKADGTECDDGTVTDACTVETCQAGVCKHGTRTCAPLDACHVAGTCDPVSGCSNPPKICTTTNPCLTPSCSVAAGGCQLSVVGDGTACTPGSPDKCFTSFACQQAVCTGTGGVTCTTPPDACHEPVGLCVPATGECAYPEIPDAGTCSPVTDAGTDSGADAGSDSGADAGTDGGSDSGADAGGDSGTDSGSAADSGQDAQTSTDSGSDSGSAPIDSSVPPSPDSGGGVSDASGDGGGNGGGQGSGCGCRVVDAEGGSPSGLAAAAALAMVLGIRRRKRR